VLELGDRRIALANEFGGARQLLVSIGECRLRRGELRLALVDRGFERVFLDRKDDLALFDLVAVFEQTRTEKALHTRPQIDLFERLGAPDELGLFRHRPQLSRLYEHGRRRPSLLSICRKSHEDHKQPGETGKKEEELHHTPVAAQHAADGIQLLYFGPAIRGIL
jgi:hypothetical protein